MNLNCNNIFNVCEADRRARLFKQKLSIIWQRIMIDMVLSALMIKENTIASFWDYWQHIKTKNEETNEPMSWFIHYLYFVAIKHLYGRPAGSIFLEHPKQNISSTQMKTSPCWLSTWRESIWWTRWQVHTSQHIKWKSLLFLFF